MTYANPSPEDKNSPDDLSTTSGLEPGGGVPPGETPPTAGTMSGTAPDDRKETPNMGPVSGNRTPMIITLVVLALMVISVAVLTGASFIAS